MTIHGEKRRQLERAYRALCEAAPPELRERLEDPHLTLDERLEVFEQVLAEDGDQIQLPH
jgi:hypothetical protein